MKTPAFLLLLVALAWPLVAAEPAKTVEPPSARTLLQEALFAEEADRDLDKASAGYAELLTQFETQRTMAATALFRLAEIRAKQKKNAEATALYQRLLTEFPTAKELVALSQQRLLALGAPTSGSNPPLAAGEEAISAKEAEELKHMQKVVKDSPDLLEAPNENGHSPLVAACLVGWFQVATFLLDHGINIDGKGGDWVPLHAAARGGHKRLVEMLLTRGANVNATARDGGWTALHSASNHNRLEVARVLIEHGAKLNEVAKDARRFEGEDATPLLIAIGKEEKEMAALLLEKGADASLANPETHRSPLFLAIWEDQEEMVAQLLDHKAQVDQPAEHSLTPLILAVLNNRVATVKLLLSRSARTDLADEGGLTALHYAAQGQAELVDLLLAAGASPKVTTADGQTPFHTSLDSLVGAWRPEQLRMGAISNQRPAVPAAVFAKIWSALRAKGGDIDAPDQRGYAPLHYLCATEHVRPEAIALLVKKGANPELKTKEGKSIYEIARDRVGVEEALLYPKLARERAVTVFDRVGQPLSPRNSQPLFPGLRPGSNPEPKKVTPESPDAAPPKLPALVPKDFPKGYGGVALIYRADGQDEVKNAVTVDVAALEDKPADAPALQWGDVVVFTLQKRPGK